MTVAIRLLVNAIDKYGPESFGFQQRAYEVRVRVILKFNFPRGALPLESRPRNNGIKIEAVTVSLSRFAGFRVKYIYNAAENIGHWQKSNLPDAGNRGREFK